MLSLKNHCDQFIDYWYHFIEYYVRVYGKFFLITEQFGAELKIKIPYPKNWQKKF
jgi:hypothetical protein